MNDVRAFRRSDAWGGDTSPSALMPTVAQLAVTVSILMQVVETQGNEIAQLQRNLKSLTREIQNG